MKYFESGDLTIYNDDINNIQDIPENSVDLIVTSPPYNVLMPYDTLKDALPYEKYLLWSGQWLAKVYDLAKPDGRFCLNIPMQTYYPPGHINTIGVDLISIAIKMGWQYRTTIIWDKIICSGSQSRGTEMDVYGMRQVDNFELIVVFYKDMWKKLERKEDGSDLTRKEYLDASDGIWRFNGRSDPSHPAVFPIELPYRCIKAFSYIGDTVLEPFLGSGTTLLAASLLNRKGIGTDISINYCDLAKNKIIQYTKEGKRKLYEDAGITYNEQDGVSNKALLDKIKLDRKAAKVTVHNIKKFIK